jgi:hypothetical protein
MIYKTVHRKLKKDKPTNYDLRNSTQEANEKGQADKL